MTHSLTKPIVILAMALACVHVQAQDAKLGVAQREAVQDVAAELLRTIYQRAGFSLTIEGLPLARLNDMVLKNTMDGEVARIGIYFERNPSLFKVEPSYYHLVTTAFAKIDRNLVISSTDDLKKYQVGIIRGAYHAAKATEGVANLVIVDDVSQLFKMLDAGRLDIVVDAGINGADMINQLGLTSSVKAVGELTRREFFSVLIPSKKDLAPKLSAVIKTMAASGELKKLTEKLENDRLNTNGVQRY